MECSVFAADRYDDGYPLADILICSWIAQQREGLLLFALPFLAVARNYLVSCSFDHKQSPAGMVVVSFAIIIYQRGTSNLSFSAKYSAEYSAFWVRSANRFGGFGLFVFGWFW